MAVNKDCQYGVKGKGCYPQLHEAKSLRNVCLIEWVKFAAIKVK